MDERFADGRDFLRRDGRLLERRLFATCFEGASGTGVLDALRGYRNDDGGFGHGLEPDKRCPASLPIDVECALQAMATARTVDLPLVQAACDYLEKVESGGAVPLAFPVIEDYPRAEHWSDVDLRAGPQPHRGHRRPCCYQLGVEHPWIAGGQRPTSGSNSTPPTCRPTRTL